MPQGNGREYVEAGLPNITGSLGGLVINGIFGSGAFYNQRANSQMGHGNNVQSNYALDFSAAQSSSVYGNSTTVQPPATKSYWIIKY